jgi:CDP-diacylglycerol--glycerol-3-phosphate 3-phosphatidyltransferase
MERAERIILLCIGLVASVILVPILWAMLILTAATAVQRFAKVWRQATLAIVVESGRRVSRPANAPGPAAADADTSAATTERWRTWRLPAPARRSGTATAARPSRVGHEIDGARRATRWEDRRAARHQAHDDGKSGGSPLGRRHGTRRP